MISASAIGIYPSSDGKKTDDFTLFDEYTRERGGNFLAQLCMDWKKETLKVNRNVRVVITRFGVVLSHKGGALKNLLRGIEFFIAREDLTGVFNLKG